jgi:AcrR family transcriptional regulator
VKTTTSPPGSSAETTRRRILDAATQAFAKQGFSGASLRDIGKIAGINFQSIRYHFGSKEQLWEVVVKELSFRGQEAGLHHEQANTALPPRERVRAQIRALVAYDAAYPQLEQILIREAIKDSDRYRKVYKAYVSRFFELSSAFLGEMQKEGVVKSDILPEDLAFIMHGALTYRLIAPAHVSMHAQKNKKTDDIVDQHADAIAKLLLVEN